MVCDRLVAMQGTKIHVQRLIDFGPFEKAAILLGASWWRSRCSIPHARASFGKWFEASVLAFDGHANHVVLCCNDQQNACHRFHHLQSHSEHRTKLFLTCKRTQTATDCVNETFAETSMRRSYLEEKKEIGCFHQAARLAKRSRHTAFHVPLSLSFFSFLSFSFFPPSFPPSFLPFF